MSWNFDISKAPRGSYVVVNRKFGKGQADTRVFKPDRVILATKCGKVTISKYLPDEKRWEMLAHGEQPVAWQAWPDHPHFHEIEGEETHLDRGTPAAPSMQGGQTISGVAS
jgi:hypothetical protein